MSARIWPSPGVSISSASAAAGSSPKISPSPRTRVCQRPNVRASPAAGRARGVRVAGGAEREHRAALAVEVAGEHVDDVDEPARDRPELLRARADPSVHGGPRRRGELPRDPPDRVGVDPAHRRDRLRREIGCLGADARRVPSVSPASRSSGRARSSSNRTWTSANRKYASVPGRMKWCSSACSAVRLRRGSRTTSLPPRSRRDRRRPRMSGAVIRLPFDASGFAPRTSR